MTFAELDAKVDETCRELEASGVSAGDRIAVCLPASLRFYTLLFATLRLGALFCPLKTVFPAQLTHLFPKLLITSSGWEALNNTTTQNLPHPSLLIFTSGSTGTPKLAVLTATQMLASAASAIACCGLCPQHAWLLSLPLHHVGGLSILFRCLLARATLTTDPSDLSISHLSYVPAQLYQSWPVYPNLSCLLLGGGPLGTIPPTLPIVASYGMTETASLILGQRDQPAGCLGFPLAGKEIRLSDEGELLVRADSLFSGYWDGKEFYRPVDCDGWFATKDLGTLHPQHGFAITGRKDNQFISGGENIQPEEIERALVQFPGILEAVVVPVRDPRFGEKPVAWLRSIDESLDPKGIERFLSDLLPKYKIPTLFFSLNTSGLKVDRKLLRELSGNFHN